MSIANFINQMSQEEQAFHKDLIAECVQREYELKAIEQTTKDSLKSFENLGNQLESLFAALNILNVNLELYYAKNIPDENYYQYLN